jgi:ketosteroid isomerase-like protein
MPKERITDEDIAELVSRCADSAVAIINGDMRTYVRLITHAEDYTLLPPFGGPPRHGFDSSDEALAALSDFFTAGESEVEVAASYASGDLVVLALIERQHAEVGGLPDQDWSLRVTLVFRREDGGWELVHRHADPLVHEIGIQQAARIARGFDRNRSG